MIVDDLIALAKNKPDDETLVERVNELYSKAGSELSDAEKIAAFDRIAKQVGDLWGDSDEADDGIIGERSDAMHLLGEEVLQAVMGDRIFDAHNKLFESF